MKNTLLLFSSLILFMVIIEFTFRLLFPQTVMPRYMVDSGFGNRVPAPNKVYHHSVPGEYDVQITTNDEGMRGNTNYYINKAKDIYRICLLGDSFVFGYGVNDSEVVSNVLENLLNKTQEKKTTFEVLNFGVSGYGQAEELNLLGNKVTNYSCDEIIMFYYSNDPGNNLVSSLYKINENGKLERDKETYLPGVWAQEILYGFPILGDVIAHSHLWSFIRNRVSRKIHSNMLKKKGLKNYLALDDQGAVELTVLLINKIREMVIENGGRFRIFVIPDLNKPVGKIKTNYPFEKNRGAGDNLIDGRNIMDISDYLMIDGHWNKNGHRKAAERIASVIRI